MLTIVTILDSTAAHPDDTIDSTAASGFPNRFPHQPVTQVQQVAAGADGEAGLGRLQVGPVRQVETGTAPRRHPVGPHGDRHGTAGTIDDIPLRRQQFGDGLVGSLQVAVAGLGTQDFLPALFQLAAVAIAADGGLGQPRFSAVVKDDFFTELKPVGEVLFDLVLGSHKSSVKVVCSSITWGRVRESKLDAQETMSL